MRRWLSVCALVAALLAVALPLVRAQTSGYDSTMTVASAGTTTGDDTNRQVTVTARDAGGSTTGTTGDRFVAWLMSSTLTCDTDAVTPECKVTCAPFLSPHTPSPSCVSSDNYDHTEVNRYSGPHWVDANVTSIGAGDYLIQYEPEYKGDYDLHVALAVQGGLRGNYYDNVWFLDNPAVTRVDPHINFNWGTGLITTYGVDYVSVRWTGKLRADTSEVYTLFMWADDGVRVWIDRRLVIDAWDVCCTEVWADVTLEQDHLHDIIIDYQELRASAAVEFRWSSPTVPKQIVSMNNLYYLEPLNTSPQTGITIGPGDPPVAENSFAEGSSLVTTTAGDISQFFIHAYDIFNNRHEGASLNATWNITIDGPASTEPANSTFYTNGTYNITYRLDTTGLYYIRVAIGGEELPGSPFTVTVNPDSTSSTDSISRGPGLEGTSAGVAGRFKLQARDQFGNNKTSGVDSVYVSLSGPDSLTSTVVYLQDGLYDILYTPTVSGNYTMNIFVNLQHVAQSPLTVEVVPGVASTSTSSATGPGLVSGTTGVPLIFYVTPRDQFGNEVKNSTFDFEATISQALDTQTVALTPLGGGQYLGNITVDTKGTWTLDVQRNGVHVDGSPYFVVVTPNNVNPQQSVATGDGLTFATVGSPAEFQVQTRDGLGNNLDDDSNDVRAEVQCASSSVAADVTYVSEGLHHVVYTPTESSPVGSPCDLVVEVEISVGSWDEVSGSPFALNIDPGTADPDQSDLFHGTDTRTAGVASEVLIIARDHSGNRKITGGNEFTLVGAGVATDAYSSGASLDFTVTDHGLGNYSASFVPVTRGEYTFTTTLSTRGGLKAWYYTDRYFENLHSEVVEATLSHHWGYYPPLSGMPADYWSARWRAELVPSISDTYTLYTPIGAQSAVRVYIDGVLVINAWDVTAGSTEPYAHVALAADQIYTLVVEYREETGEAGLELLWEASDTIKSVVPAIRLFWNGDVASSPYTFLVEPASTAATYSYVQDLSTPTSADDLTFTLFAMDGFQNPQDHDTESGDFSCWVEYETDPRMDTCVITGAQTPTEQGKYDVTVHLEFSGEAVLHVQHLGVGIAGSPWLLEVVPGAVNGNWSSFERLQNSTSAVQSFLEFQVRDGTGNPVGRDALLDDASNADNGSVSFQVEFDLGGLGTTTVSADKNDLEHLGGGRYRLSYTLMEAGNWAISCAIGGVACHDGRTFVVHNFPAVADPTATTLEFGLPNGTLSTLSSFVISARDAQGNEQTTYDHQFYVRITNHNGTLLKGRVERQGTTGNYTVLYEPTDTGRHTLTVRLANNDHGVADGLTGFYYNNRWLQGDPVLTRVDRVVDFDWGLDVITPTGKDYVSVFWDGYILPPNNGTYEFQLQADDGCRMYVDGVLLIDEWRGTAGTHYANFTFDMPDTLYDVRIDFRENTADAHIHWRWRGPLESVGAAVYDFVPQTALFSGSQHISGSPFLYDVE